MAGGSGVDGHETLSTGSYPQFLLPDEENCYHFAATAFSAEQNAPRMLCFGPGDHFNREKCDLLFNEVSSKLAAGVACSGGVGGQPYPVTAAPITGASSTNGNKNAALAGDGRSNPVWSVTPAVMEQQSGSKKAKVSGNSPETAPPRHAKMQVKKEKLGERIVALQQLVSPFGKTDTASVLHEALGYIRFLQDQVQALCSPYLRRLPPPAHLQVKEEEEEEEGGEGGGEARADLRSRGLCLVPADLTAHVVEGNGADLWTPGSSPFRMTSNR